MVTKADLYRLIDQLPEPALPAAERSLAALKAGELAQRIARLSPESLQAVALFVGELEADEAAPHVPPNDAPPDDEPESDAERAAAARARAEIARGDFVSDEELARDLGL